MCKFEQGEEGGSAAAKTSCGPQRLKPLLPGFTVKICWPLLQGNGWEQTLSWHNYEDSVKWYFLEKENLLQGDFQCPFLEIDIHGIAF